MRIMWSIFLLHVRHTFMLLKEQPSLQMEKSDLLPFMVLITDGPVPNEQNKKLLTRFLCLGMYSFSSR